MNRSERLRLDQLDAELKVLMAKAVRRRDLLELSKSSSPELRASALAMLRKEAAPPTPSKIARMRELALSSSDPAVRASAIRWLSDQALKVTADKVPAKAAKGSAPHKIAISTLRKVVRPSLRKT